MVILLAMKKSLKLVIGVFVVLFVATVSTVLFMKNDNNVAQDQTNVLAIYQISDQSSGVSLSYPDPLTSDQLTDTDREDGFLFRLTSQDPPTIVSIRQETGLRAVTTLANVDVLDLLSANAEKALPDRYPGYSVLSENQLSVGGKDAVEIVFTYNGPSSENVQQKLLIIEKDPNTAVYISMQTAAANYESVQKNQFQPILEALEIK